jgi:aminopeptidase N
VFLSASFSINIRGKIAQVVVENFIYGGMENTSATVINKAIYNKKLKNYSSDALISHELGHQW